MRRLRRLYLHDKERYRLRTYATTKWQRAESVREVIAVWHDARGVFVQHLGVERRDVAHDIIAAVASARDARKRIQWHPYEDCYRAMVGGSATPKAKPATPDRRYPREEADSPFGRTLAALVPQWGPYARWTREQHAQHTAMMLDAMGVAA